MVRSVPLPLPSILPCGISLSLTICFPLLQIPFFSGSSSSSRSASPERQTGFRNIFTRKRLISEEKKNRVLVYTQQRACLFASSDDYVDLICAIYKQEFDFDEMLYRKRMREYVFEAVRWRRLKREYPRAAYLNLLFAVYSMPAEEETTAVDAVSDKSNDVDDETFCSLVREHRYTRPRFLRRSVIRCPSLYTLPEIF